MREGLKDRHVAQVSLAFVLPHGPHHSPMLFLQCHIQEPSPKAEQTGPSRATNEINLFSVYAILADG